MKHLRFASALAVALLVGCAYKTPTAPTSTSTQPSPTAPASLSIGFTAGVGSQAGIASIIATVQNAAGSRLANVAVTFATDNGTLSDARVFTDGNGESHTRLTASSTATITATAGSITTKQLVVAEPPPPPPIVVTPPVFPPPPPPPPQPPTPQPSYGVTLAASPSSLVAGQSTTLTATVTLQNGAPAPASYVWDCQGSGGVDGTTAGPSFSSCVYANTTAAPVTIMSKVTAKNATTSGSGSVGVSVVPVVVTVSCTGGAHGLPPRPCNVSATVNGAVVTAQITNVAWDWDDGSAIELDTTPLATHTYAQQGVYTVSATVTLGAPNTGGTGRATTSLSIS